MELRDAILGRRSIRKYKDTPVSDEVLNEIMECAIWAPSGVNLQPWYFAVLRSKEARDKVLGYMDTAAAKFEPDLKERFPNHPDVVKETVTFLKNVGGAPVYVLAFQYTEYKTEEQTVAAQQSVPAAIENLLLAAWDKGLGSCWMTAPYLIKDELTRDFGQGKGRFVAMVALGYPDEPGRAPTRKDGRYELL